MAAITAKLRGLRPLLIEKTPLIARFHRNVGRLLWLPNNPLMRRQGIAHSHDEAQRYMENFVGKDDRYLNAGFLHGAEGRSFLSPFTGLNAGITKVAGSMSGARGGASVQ